MRTTISKAEYRACRWAVNYLIPENDLLDVIRSGLYESWEIAEHFDVTEACAIFRLRVFGARNAVSLDKLQATFEQVSC